MMKETELILSVKITPKSQFQPIISTVTLKHATDKKLINTNQSTVQGNRHVTIIPAILKMKEIELPIASARIELVIILSMQIKLRVHKIGKRVTTTCIHKYLIVLFCRNILNSLSAALSLILKVHLLISSQVMLIINY